MSLRKDQDWATSIYQERAELVDADEEVTCFFLENYSEICRYMRVIGYGSKGKAESVEAQVARGLVLGATARFGRRSGENNLPRISRFLSITILMLA